METSARPSAGPDLTSAEIERYFPHSTSIIYRGSWETGARALFNEQMGRLGDHRSNNFNGLLCCRFENASSAEELGRLALRFRLHRLTTNSTHGASPEEVALEFERMDAEREEILAWGRSTRMLREVVQQYRFERSRGAYSYAAHQAAARIIEQSFPCIRDPLNYAGVLIVWAEKEHRTWFWHCCRHQVL